MKNRVEKLMKEKRKALSNIKLAKNRNVFIKKVNIAKDKQFSDKQQYRHMMHQKLNEQQQTCKQQRREIKDNIESSKQAKIDENRLKKKQERELKEVLRKEKLQTEQYLLQKTYELKEKVHNQRKQKSQKLDTIKNLKSDHSQIRYHLKNEKLASTREDQLQEIEELKRKEEELVDKLKHTLDRQEKIEEEAKSPAKFRRAPSLNMEAKYALFKNKLNGKSLLNKTKIVPNESFGSFMSKDSNEPEKPIEDSDTNKEENTKVQDC
jgi:hypothetical protein